MKPRLYRNDATEFDNLGFGVLTTAFFCEVTEQLNQAPTLELHLLNYDPIFQYVTTGNIIAVQPNNYDPIQAFIIEEVHKTIAEEVTVYATHIAAHRAKLIPVSAFTATTLNAALSALISHSMETNPLTLKKDSGKNNVTATMETTHPASLRELLGGSEGSIIDIYRGEWAYDNFTMTLYNKRGHDNGVRVMYRKNMTDFQLGELFDWAESVNGCIGFWQNEETTVTSAIQYAAGASDYPYKKTVVVDFTDKFEDPPTVAQLNDLAAAWIAGKGAPAINMDVTFDRLAFDDHKTITLGDTVQVINPDLNINTTRRIVGLVYDTLAEEYTTITIGDQKETINEAISDAVQQSEQEFQGLRVGDILITDSNTNPRATHGGTWEEIDREFAARTNTEITSQIILDSTNCSAFTCWTMHSGHSIRFAVRFTTKVTMSADNRYKLATIPPSAVGASAFGDGYYFTMFSDAKNALLSLYMDGNGNFYVDDAWIIQGNPAQSVTAGQFSWFNFTIDLPKNYLLTTPTSWVNKYYWRRTA